MTKVVKEFLLDHATGEVSFEYDDNSTSKYNLSNAVTATQSAQGIPFSAGTTPGQKILRKHPSLAVYNINGLKRYFGALADAERAPVYTLWTGNSTLDGVSTDGTTTPSDVEMDKYSYVGLLRSKFARYYGTNEAGSIPAKDSRWVMTGTTSSLTTGTTVTGPGGNLFRNMPAGAVATLTTPKCTDIIIDYFGGTGYGSFKYSVDGGAETTVDATNPTAGSYRQAVASLSGLADTTHVIVVTSLATCYFGGCRYHSGRGVIVSKYARSSWGMYDWFGIGGNSTGASVAGQIRAKQGCAMGNPHLFILSFVRNDMMGRLTKPLNIQGVPANGGYDLWADYQFLYDTVVAAGGCMLILGEPGDMYYPALINYTDADKPTMVDVEGFHRRFAASHEHCAFLNLPELFGYWAEANGRGFYRNSSDSIHWGRLGLGATADALYEIMKPGYVFAD